MTTTAQPVTSLSQAVDQIRDRHVAAVNAGDVDAASGIFAPEGVFLPPGQPALKGTAIRGWFEYVFGAFRIQGFGLQPGAAEVHGDLVIEHGDWKATFQPKQESDSIPGGGTYLTVYARQPDGSARVMYDTFNGLPG